MNIYFFSENKRNKGEIGCGFGDFLPPNLLINGFLPLRLCALARESTRV